MSYEWLPWDSDFFQIPIGRVRYEPDYPQTLANAVLSADADGIQCLYLLAPKDDLPTLRAALHAGFRRYDVRVELSRSLSGVEPTAPPMRYATAADEPALARIASERFTDTRFFADSHFPRDRCRELYVAWLRRGLSTAPLRRTLTAADSEGFVICRFDAAAKAGTIELIAVAANATGRQLGGRLVRAAMGAFATAGLNRTEVATQGRNAVAKRLYERHGFHTVKEAVWLHRWREDH